MAYCRFVNGSDVYVYADIQGGWTLHVANNREIKGRRISTGMLKGLPRVRKLKLKDAGRSFNVGTREEMIFLMLRLRQKKLRVPRQAIKRLLDEVYQN